MGNSAQTWGGNASVQVALQRSQYASGGEPVRGYVQVDARDQLSCTEMYVRLFGEVRTTVRYQRTTGSGDNRRTTTHYAHGHSTIVEERRLVARFPGATCNPGMYQFPFEFLLHPGLPSSVYVSGSSNARLEYGVEVQLQRPGMFEWNLVHKNNFDMIAQVGHAIQPTMSYQTVPVNTCCCFSNGQATLGARLEKNAFAASEAIGVQYDVNNQSSKDIDNIVVSLYEEIWFKAAGHSDRKYTTITNQGFFGVQAGSTLPTQHVQLRLPPHFEHCSVDTNILEVNHYVIVRANTACCVDNPEVRLQVTLHRSHVQLQAPPPLEGEIQVGLLLPYQPDANAMSSPEPIMAVPITNAAAPVAGVITAQALQAQPMQGQAMYQPPQQAMYGQQPIVGQPIVGQPIVAQPIQQEMQGYNMQGYPAESRQPFFTGAAQ